MFKEINPFVYHQLCQRIYKKQLKVLYRLNELLKQQGAERLRHINLERIARWYFSEGNEELGGKLYLELIMYWSKNYPQSAIYSTENYVKSLLKQKKFEKALEVITSFKNKYWCIELYFTSLE